MHSSSFYWPLGLNCIQQNHIFALSIKIGSVQLNSACSRSGIKPPPRLGALPSRWHCHCHSDSVTQCHTLTKWVPRARSWTETTEISQQRKNASWWVSRMIADSQLACFNEKKIWQELHILDAHANFTIHQVSLSGEESLAVRAITGSQHSGPKLSYLIPM